MEGDIKNGIYQRGHDLKRIVKPAPTHAGRLLKMKLILGE